MRNFFSSLSRQGRRWKIYLLWLAAAEGTIGCSSPEQNYPYNTVKLTEIRQTPGGQLAFVYEEKRGRPPGQRIFLADQHELDRDLMVAKTDLYVNKSADTAFAGGIILHRNRAIAGVGPDSYWMQIDPYELSGKWSPPLSMPALSPEMIAQSLAPSPMPGTPTAIPTAPLPLPLAALPDIQFAAVKPDQHFRWTIANDTLETSVSTEPLIRANEHELLDRTGQVVGGGLALAGAGAIFALEVITNCGPCRPNPNFHR